MEVFHSLCAAWFPFIADFTIKSSFFLAVVLLTISILKKTSASVRHLLCLLAVVSVLVTPLLFYLSTELDMTIFILGQGDPRDTQSSGGALPGEWNAHEKTQEKNPAFNGPAAAEDVLRQGRSEEPDERKFSLPAFLKDTTWQMWLAVFWMIGISVCLFRMAFGAKKIRQRKKDLSPPKNQAITDLLDEIAIHLNIKRSVSLGISKKQNIPAAYGIFRPVIILPQNAQKWSPNRLRSILLHEMAHIKRFDYLFNVLAYAVSLLFWFNPLLWLAVRKLHHEAECACDDVVVSHGTRPTVYAHYLIKSARLLMRQKWASPLETAMAKKSCLEGRILSIVDEKKTRKRVSRGTAVCLLLVTAVFVTLAACTRFEEKNYTVEVVDGVKHIHNLYPRFKDKPEIKLDFVWEIGGLEGGDENYLFYNAFDATFDQDGNVYVLDSGNDRIQVFDPAGSYLSTIGREGQGPGEFQQLFSMDIKDDGFLYIYDRGKGSMDFFDREGKFIKSTRLQGYYPYIRITGTDTFCSPLMDVMYPGLLIMRQAFPGRKDIEAPKSIVSVRLPEETKKEFCAGLPEEGITHGSQINANVFETDIHSNLFVVFKHQNKIEKYSPDGRPVFISDRPLNFPIEYKRIERTWRSGDVSKKFPEFGGTYVSEGIGIDRTGRIWVVTYTDQPVTDEELNIIRPGMKVFEIFSPGGILLTRVPYPDENILFVRLKDSHLLFTDKDYMAIHKYRIVDL